MATPNAQMGEAYLIVDRFHAALRNMNDLEKGDIRNVVMGVLNPTLREKCVTLNYHRAAVNVELLLALTDTRQFQAIAMLARTIFELAVELKSISLDADAAEKIDLFTRIELLRSAERIVAFKRDHPDAKIHYETQDEFIRTCAVGIRKDQNTMWPGITKIKHWTKKDLAARAKELGDPFDRIYEVHYAELSWFSHSGVTGLGNANTNLIAMSAGTSYSIAVDSYMQILEVVVNEFKLYATMPVLKDKIAYMKMTAFTESQEEANRLRQAYGV